MLEREGGDPVQLMDVVLGEGKDKPERDAGPPDTLQPSLHRVERVLGAPHAVVGL